MDATEYLDWFNNENGLFGGDYFLELENNPDYDSTLKEVDFLQLATGIKDNSRILDLGCGYGRHAIEMAKRGFEVVGVDSNPVFLSVAENAAKKEGVNVDWMQRDMRNLSFDSEFDLIISLFTSFGYFQTDEEDYSVVEGVKKSLKSGGKFFLDIANKEKIIRMFREKDWRKLSDGSIVVIERRFDFTKGREFEKRIIIRENGKIENVFCSFRRYTLVEIIKMCKTYGLNYLSSYGDFDGGILGVNSTRCIVVANRD